MKITRPHKPVQRARAGGNMKRISALVALGLVALFGGSPAQAATQVIDKNPGGSVAVGPVNTEYGFPSWYQDSAGTRVELCLDAENPHCGFLPGDIPDEDAAISFPGNFPDEAFYMLASTTLDLPGGGGAVLVLGLEAAFANQVQAGDQVVFGRQRVTVRGAQPNTTLTFRHPYGSLSIDTDSSGAGKLVEDISPAAGNFTTALKSNIGPFLRWDPATAPVAPAGYLGDPAQEHTITGSPFGYNQFSVSGGGLNLSTDLFSLQGKISTNNGVEGQRALLQGNMLDVFATSEGTQLQVEGQDGKFATTPMETDQGSNRFYARINLAGSAPTSIKISNIGDKPVSNSVLAVTTPHGITVLKADYDGTKLSIAAKSRFGNALSATGLGALTGGASPESEQSADFTVLAPPERVTVQDSTGAKTTVDVSIVGGDATPEGLPPVDPEPDPGPVVDPAPDPAAPAIARATPASASVNYGGALTLDGTASSNAVTYKWTQLSGVSVALSSDTSAKPTITVPYFAQTTDTSPVAVPETNEIRMSLVVSNARGEVSEPAVVELALLSDTVTIDAGTRHRLGTEFRISGTATLPGSSGALTPGTRIVIYDTTPGLPIAKLGTAVVDAANIWQLRIKPGPSRQITATMVQSSRGGVNSAAVSTR